MVNGDEGAGEKVLDGSLFVVSHALLTLSGGERGRVERDVPGVAAFGDFPGPRLMSAR